MCNCCDAGCVAASGVGGEGCTSVGVVTACINASSVSSKGVLGRGVDGNDSNTVVAAGDVAIISGSGGVVRSDSRMVDTLSGVHSSRRGDGCGID